MFFLSDPCKTARLLKPSNLPSGEFLRAAPANPGVTTFCATITIDDNQNHYDSKTDKCLLFLTRAVINKFINFIMTYWELIDAVEKRTLASFGITQSYDVQDARLRGRNLPDKTTWCELTPSWQKKIKCKDRAEFDAFVATYMGE